MSIKNDLKCFWYSPESISEPDSEHMVADEKAFASVEQGNADVIVRCYKWASPAVTIGRLQDEKSLDTCYINHPKYRRPTGGLAVLHGDDLTICVAAKQLTARSEDSDIVSPLIKRGVLSDYFRVTEPIRLTLADHSITAHYGKDTVHCNREKLSRVGDCFAINAQCDIVDAQTGSKIVGSAMRRGKTAFIVQSSLKKQSSFDIFGDEFLQSLQTHLARYLSIEHWDFPYR